MTDDGALQIDYAGVAVDKVTIANFTSHGFFNLSGNGGTLNLGHVLTVDADRFLEVDSTGIPTGRLLDVAGTPLDFRRATPSGRESSRIIGSSRMSAAMTTPMC